MREKFLISLPNKIDLENIKKDASVAENVSKYIMILTEQRVRMFKKHLGSQVARMVEFRGKGVGKEIEVMRKEQIMKGFVGHCKDFDFYFK